MMVAYYNSTRWPASRCCSWCALFLSRCAGFLKHLSRFIAYWTVWESSYLRFEDSVLRANIIKFAFPIFFFMCFKGRAHLCMRQCGQINLFFKYALQEAGGPYEKTRFILAWRTVSRIHNRGVRIKERRADREALAVHGDKIIEWEKCQTPRDPPTILRNCNERIGTEMGSNV